MAILSASLREWTGDGKKKLPRAWLVVCALFFSSGPDLSAQTAISKEYQLKSVFLFNFAQFVAWPTNDLPDTQTPLTIGVLGDDPFGTYLDETVRGEKVGGHPLIIQRCRNTEEAKHCQILFISRSESKRMKQILSDVQGPSILTVGDLEGFNKNGGIIRFVTEQNKIHLRINLAAAKSANLTISSKILRLAEIVEPGKD